MLSQSLSTVPTPSCLGNAFYWTPFKVLIIYVIPFTSCSLGFRFVSFYSPCLFIISSALIGGFYSPFEIPGNSITFSARPSTLFDLSPSAFLKISWRLALAGLFDAFWMLLKFYWWIWNLGLNCLLEAWFIYFVWNW